MAGDWIKMTTNLHECPEVIQLAGALGKNRFDIVGRLHRVWSWYDAHTADGHAKGVTSVTLDELASCDGFATAMIDVGWIKDVNGDLCMAKFDRHNGKSAKQRAEAAERKRKSRGNSDTCHANGVTKTGPEKRREEKSIKESPLPPFERTNPKFRRPTLSQAIEAASRIGISRNAATLWWNKREASEWMKGTAGGGTTPVGQNWQADLAASKGWAEEEAKKSPASESQQIQFID